MKLTLKKMVENCLRNLPETRNNDKTLTLAVWRKYFSQYRRKSEASDKFGYWEEDILLLPSQDNVKRIRAKFNSEGKYYPTDWAVAKARGIKEDIWRVELGYPIKQDTMFPTRKDSYMDPERSFKN